MVACSTLSETLSLCIDISFQLPCYVEFLSLDVGALQGLFLLPGLDNSPVHPCMKLSCVGVLVSEFDTGVV